MNDKLRSKKLTWYGHVVFREEQNVIMKVFSIEVEDDQRKNRWVA